MKAFFSLEDSRFLSVSAGDGTGDGGEVAATFQGVDRPVPQVFKCVAPSHSPTPAKLPTGGEGRRRGRLSVPAGSLEASDAS